MDTTEVSPKIPATPPANTDIDVRLKLSDLEFSITLRELMGMTGRLVAILVFRYISRKLILSEKNRKTSQK
jgi:hypothetical protein